MPEIGNRSPKYETNEDLYYITKAKSYTRMCWQIWEIKMWTISQFGICKTIYIMVIKIIKIIEMKSTAPYCIMVMEKSIICKYANNICSLCRYLVEEYFLSNLSFLSFFASFSLHDLLCILPTSFGRKGHHFKETHGRKPSSTVF